MVKKDFPMRVLCIYIYIFTSDFVLVGAVDMFKSVSVSGKITGCLYG